MAGKRRRLINWQCCCGNPTCAKQEDLANQEGSGLDAEHNLLCVDTHVHLNEVFVQIRVSEQVPSLKKTWDEMTDEERRSWTTLGWDCRKWRSWVLKLDTGGQDTGQKVWAACFTSYGTKYYYNTLTAETTWDKPSDVPDALVDDYSDEQQEKEVECSQTQAARDPFDLEWAYIFPWEREAAVAIGYTESTWDQLGPPVIPSLESLRRAMRTFACISTGCDPDSLEDMLFIHRSIPLPPKRLVDAVAPDDGFPGFVWVALGCHPKSAAEFSLSYAPKDWENLEKFEARLRVAAAEMGDRLVAWGEIGLDYSHPVFGRDEKNQWFQQEVFKRQIGIGMGLGLPLIVHSRDAWEDTIWILRKHVPWDYPVHVHCFWDSKQAMNDLFNAFPKAVIGFSNNVFYAGDIPQQLCQSIPLEHVVLETDAPYLPRLGNKMSTPGDIPAIGQKIAELKGVPFSTVMDAVRQNVFRIYGI